VGRGEIQAEDAQPLLHALTMRLRGYDHGSLTSAKRPRDEVADSVEQEIVGFVELNEVVRGTGFRPARGGLARGPAGLSDLGEGPIEVFAPDARGALAQAGRLQPAGADPAPDTDAADAEQLGGLRDAVVLATGRGRAGLAGGWLLSAGSWLVAGSGAGRTRCGSTISSARLRAAVSRPAFARYSSPGWSSPASSSVSSSICWAASWPKVEK
jgi:hypothetical protein